MQTRSHTWRFGVGNLVLIGFVAAFEFGIAVLLLALPSIAGGVPGGIDWVVAATATIVLGFALFMTFGLIAMVRTRISLDGTTLDATVPYRHGPLLIPHFRTISLPAAQIRSVERRHEVIRSFGFVTLRESLSVVTTAGERFGLFSNTAGPANQLPLDDIAAAIAAAAGVAVTDAGTVRSSAPGLYGEASSSWTEPQLDPVSAAKARRAAVLTLQISTTLLLLVFVLRACT